VMYNAEKLLKEITEIEERLKRYKKSWEGVE
jgi:7,8-dihydro-6-hydroxymethylpterin-pyrophosphokinase